jgi:chromate reductase, NAD(P)H dehydrogenase (quinone)
MATKIAGIAGSLRRGSANRMLLHAAAAMLPPAIEFTDFDLLDRVPPFNEDWEGDPAPLAVERLRQLIADADGLLIATPEYNGSIPGQLKNALDWASRPRGGAVLQGKPAAVISASPRAPGAAWAGADLRRILAIAGASVVDLTLAVPRAFAQLAPGGLITDPGLDAGLRAVIHELLTQTAGSRLLAHSTGR